MLCSLWTRVLAVVQCLLLVQQVHAGRGVLGASRDFTVATPEKRGGSRQSESHVQSTDLFGESHGKDFNDVANSQIRHRRIAEVNLVGCGAGEHLGSIQSVFRVLGFPAPGNYKNPGDLSPTHGFAIGVSGTASLKLDTNEFINQVDVTTYRAKTGFMHRSKRTRIGSITLHTNTKRSVTCGAKNSHDPSTSWSFKDSALLYFSGSDGDAIDALAGHFIKVSEYFP